MLTGILVAMIVYAIIAARKKDGRHERPHQTGPRLREGPQVVGFPCAKCGERIIFDHEAAPCAECGKPVHLGCLPHAHEAAAGAPYRGPS